MKKQILVALMVIFSFNSYAQIIFEKGYFISDSGDKTVCLIKNIDWANNPTEFKYKISENSEVKEETINSVKEFGISNTSKYVRFSVKIDRSKSSSTEDELSFNKEPEFSEETLFLKTLVEGKATLYAYEDTNLYRYFYSVNNSAVEQLIFKSYQIRSTSTGEYINTFTSGIVHTYIGNNHKYKQQLWENFKCGSITRTNIRKIAYIKSDLIKFFVKYNTCEKSEYTNYEKNKKSGSINLYVRPGLNYSSLSMQSLAQLNNSKNIAFESELGFRLGSEFEFIMPFNKNKWAFIIEPTFQTIQFEAETFVIETYNGYVPDDNIQNVIINYKSFELSGGLRHYLYFNKNSKMFINGSVVFEVGGFNSIVEFEKETDHEIEPGPTLAIGFGYNYKNKYSVEFRYNPKDMLKQYFGWEADNNNIFFIFGYNIF